MTAEMPHGDGALFVRALSDGADKFIYKIQGCADGRRVLPVRADQDLVPLQSERGGGIDMLQQPADIFFRKIRGQVAADDDRRIDDHVHIPHGECEMF